MSNEVDRMDEVIQERTAKAQLVQPTDGSTIKRVYIEDPEHDSEAFARDEAKARGRAGRYIPPATRS